MSEIHNQLAKILNIKLETLLDLDEKLSKLTGKTDVLKAVFEKNKAVIKQNLDNFGLAEDSTADEVYAALSEKVRKLDQELFEYLGRPDLAKSSVGGEKLRETLFSLNKPKGFFIKREKIAELLASYPPQNMLDHFGYKTTTELLEKEDITSVVCALRFVQDENWMHKFFDEAYGGLTADDFEERDVEIKILEPKWSEIARKFLEKKFHNISHLKEFGIIFVIPMPVSDGETLRMFSLLLHYLNEVPFYSRLIKKYSAESNFVSKFKSLLRGDVPETVSGDWMIIQRYLVKDNPDDSRLAVPHINPEPEHWYRAEADLAKLDFAGDWRTTDFAGGFFKDGGGGEKMVSFNLMDIVMSLIKDGKVRYSYHHDEALWNEIFIGYFGRDRMNELIEENIISGFIEL